MLMSDSSFCNYLVAPFDNLYIYIFIYKIHFALYLSCFLCLSLTVLLSITTF